MVSLCPLFLLLLLPVPVHYGQLLPRTEIGSLHSSVRQLISAESLIFSLEQIIPPSPSPTPSPSRRPSTVQSGIPPLFGGGTLNSFPELGLGSSSDSTSSISPGGGGFPRFPGDVITGVNGIQSGGIPALPTPTPSPSRPGRATRDAELAKSSAESLRECQAQLDDLKARDDFRGRLSPKLRRVLRSTNTLIEFLLEALDRLSDQTVSSNDITL